MANRADNQARRDDVAAGPGERAFKELFIASGSANAEGVDVDKAVELGILDVTRANALRASELDAEFDRVFKAEKGARKPALKAFIDAFNAVYGKPRFEAPAVSEMPDGKKQSPLVAVMARVLKNNDGLNAEGANFEGRPELRVMACAMDDMMLEREEAQAKVPGLRKRKEKLTEERDRLRPKQRRIEILQEDHRGLLDGIDQQDFVYRYKKAKEDVAKAQNERDAEQGKLPKAEQDAQEAKAEALKHLEQIKDLQKFLEIFHDELRVGNYQAYYGVVANFERKVADFSTDPEQFDEKKWEEFLNKDFKQFIEYFEKTPLMETAVAASDRPDAMNESKEELQKQFEGLKWRYQRLFEIKGKVVTAANMEFAERNQRKNLSDAEQELSGKEAEFRALRGEIADFGEKFLEAVERLKDDQQVKVLLPQVKADCDRFLATDVDFHGGEEADTFRILETVMPHFLETLRTRFNDLSKEQRSKLAEVDGELITIDAELQRLTGSLRGGDPEKRVLEATFPGMEIGDDGEISVHGFKGSTGRVMEKFDGKKDGAGNVVEVGAIPWFVDSRNLGGIESGMAELEVLMKKLDDGGEIAEVLKKIGVDVSPQQRPPIARIKQRIAQKIEAKRSNHISDPDPKEVRATLKERRERFANTNPDDDFDEDKAREEILAPYAARRDKQAEEIGELTNALEILKKIEELTAKLEPKCKELVAHLGVGNTAEVFGKAGLKFKKADGTEVQFAEVETAAAALDAGKPKTFLDFYAMLKGERDGKEIGFFTDENKVDALVGEYRKVRAGILEMTSKESPEAAKKVVAAMLAEQRTDMTPEQINDLATAIIRDGVGIMATKKNWLQVAKECQPKALENLQALAFRDKLSKFKMKKGDKKTTPFASLKPENFADQAAIEKTFKTLERTKGKAWVLEHGFYILAAFKVFEGNRKVDASGQGVAIEKYLKNMLAEKRLEQHPEFDSVNKAMMDSDFVKLIDAEFEQMAEHGALKFGEFSDAYDAKGEGMKMKLALKLDRDIKVLKAKRKAKAIGKKEYDQQFTALLEQAEEEGVRGMLKEVSPRWQVSTAAAMSGFWNNDFMLGVRGVRENVADWLKAKSKALGATTIGGAVKGGFEFMKRIGIGSIVGGVMAPIGITRWTLSFLKNLVLGRWTFGSTRAMIGSDFGVAGKYVSGGVGKALSDTAARVKGMWEKVRNTKSDDAKAKRKEKGAEKLKLAESDAEALKGKTELDAVEVPDDPFKDITASFEKKHAALAERKKPGSMRQERPSGQQERLAA